MKKKGFLCSIVGAMALLVSLAFAGIPAKAVTKTTLRPAGTIKDSHGIRVEDNYLYTQNLGMETLLDAAGNPVKGAEAGKIKKSDGYLVLARPGKPLNECAVATLDGKIMIPYGPAVVQKINERFWLAGYAKEETKDKEKAIIYSSDKLFSIQPDEKDKLYTGELTVYDITTGKQVPGIKETSPKAKLDAVGDTVYVRGADGSTSIYDATGKAIEKDASAYQKVGNRFYLKSEGGKYTYYDGSLKKLFTSDKYFGGITDTDYLYESGDKNVTLVDSTGKKIVTSQTKGNFSELNKGSLVLDNGAENFVTFCDSSTSDYLQGLYQTDGTMILKPEFRSLTYMGYGYLSGSRKKGDETVYDIYDIKGNLIGKELENFASVNMVAYKKGSGDTKDFFVFNKKDYALSLKNGTPMGLGLIRSQSALVSKYGLYDAFTGEELLKEEYDQISYCNGKIYAEKDGAYEIYDVVR